MAGSLTVAASLRVIRLGVHHTRVASGADITVATCITASNAASPPTAEEACVDDDRVL